MQPSKRRARLETWLDVELQLRFADRILPVDAAIANRWGLLAAGAKMEGRSLSVIDGLLAATALQYNFALVTRNVSDFAQIDPWEL